ncbi:MAG: RimK/LysX family protein [Gemmatimonadota bacterium]|nr:RimK/LysX family protein [Gemmatimonadota bacterium]
MKKKIIGWKEWVTLPEFGGARIKAKIDTGARSSSLHVFNLEVNGQDGNEYAEFDIRPDKRGGKALRCRTRVEGYRKVKSSNGLIEQRPVVVTRLALFKDSWPIEVTLTNRDGMRYQMLLGRRSIRDRFYVDADGAWHGRKKKKGKATGGRRPAADGRNNEVRL